MAGIDLHDSLYHCRVKIILASAGPIARKPFEYYSSRIKQYHAVELANVTLQKSARPCLCFHCVFLVCGHISLLSCVVFSSISSLRLAEWLVSF